MQSLKCLLSCPLQKIFAGPLKKLKIALPYDSEIPLLGIHPEKMKTYNLKRYMHPVFIATEFTVAQKWKQPKRSSKKIKKIKKM